MHSRRAPLVGLGVLALACALGVVASAQAAPPVNDSFATAAVLSGESGSVAGTNVEATKEAGEPNHAGNVGGRSVWYTWTAPFSGQAVFETCGSATFDTLLGIYVGTTLLSLAVAGVSDDGCADQSRAAANVTAGTVYHVALDGFDGATGTFTLRWSKLLPPANDNFADALAITGATGGLDGSNFGATSETGEPLPAPTTGASVWYAWTAGFTGGITFQTCGASSFDTVLAVYTGDALTSLTRIAVNDDACLVFSRVRFLARSGTTYRIAVYGLAQTTGTFRFSWTGAPRPPNDNFAAARTIRGSRGVLSASNVGASAEPGERAHFRIPASSSMWYRWRAPRTARVLFETCGSRFDTILAVYRGTSVRRAALVGANDDACARAGSRVVIAAKKGTTYRIAVEGFRGDTGTFRLKWGPPPASVQPCIVPDVRGVTLPQARRAIAKTDCRLGRIRFVQSFTVPSGFVISQRPAPGTRRAFGTRVDLDVSRGR